MRARVAVFAIALLAAATLGYEILLMRLFSIIQWHHFAYMMISVAMLGFGAAGAFVALAQRYLSAHFAPAFLAAATAFGITAVAGFLLAQQVAFNPLELLWDPAQPLRLLAVYALLFVPFFCSPRRARVSPLRSLERRRTACTRATLPARASVVSRSSRCFSS